MAKEVATLDFYSGGHVLFGIGAGWLADETEIFGVEFRKCWPVTREYVAAMKRLWTEPQASYEGEFVKFPPVKSYPKPAQKPHPPIIIGAGGLESINSWRSCSTLAVCIAIEDDRVAPLTEPSERGPPRARRWFARVRCTTTRLLSPDTRLRFCLFTRL